MIYFKFYVAMCLFAAAYFYNFLIAHENELKDRILDLELEDEILQTLDLINIKPLILIVSIFMGIFWPVFVILIFGASNNDNS